MTVPNHAQSRAKSKSALSPATKISINAPKEQATQSPLPITDNDDLTLQPLEPSAAQNGKFAPKHLMPSELSDKPKFQFGILGDTSHLLVLFFVVLVAIILISLYVVIFGQDSPSGKPSSPPKTATASNKATPSNANSKNKTPTPTITETEQSAAYLNNPANRECFHSFLKFMAWTYSEAGTKLNGAQLAEKLQKDVSLNSVDDPQVRKMYAVTLESFNLAKDHPRGRLDSSGLIITSPAGQGILISNEQVNKWRDLIMRVKILSNTARKHYGDPPPEIK